MSTLREQQSDACLDWLFMAVNLPLFGKQSQATWTEAYRLSFYFDERKSELLPTLRTVRGWVKKGIANELPLITRGEEALLQRALLFGGETILLDSEENASAVSLVKRLWCYVAAQGEGPLLLTVYPELIKPMVERMQSEEYAKARSKVFTLSATLHSLIYLNGFLYVGGSMEKMIREAMQGVAGDTLPLLARSLRSEFDYCRDERNGLVLLHPGLAEPEKLLCGTYRPMYQEPRFTQEMLVGGLNELLREEAPSVEALRRELQHTLQPEYDAENTVNDLKLLFKQGAAYQDVKEVLSARLGVVMTERIEAALRRLDAETVRWTGIPASRLN
ncbi:MAG: hypothetical protein IJ240_04520 [Clostridia bacterium]|nr:hypothetical protein [Clostridia bacterium]